MLTLQLLLACSDASPVDDSEEKDTAQAFELVGTLDVPMARWGVDVPNTVKIYASAWDGGDGLLYVSGIQLPNILVIDPEEGHPSDGFTFELTGHHNPFLVGDFPRRRLYWLARGNGGVIAFDLDTRTELWRNEAAREDGSSLSHIAAGTAVVDPADGSLYVLDGDEHVVLRYGPEGLATPVVGPTSPSGLAADPAGDQLFILDAADDAIYRYRPSTGDYTWFAASAEAPYGALAVADDGAVVVAAITLTVFEPDGTPRWQAEAAGGPLDLEVANGYVAVTISDQSDGLSEEYNREAHLYDLADGSTWEATAEWGAEQITADPAGDRFFVSNGSNGTISVIDAATGATTSTLGVANVPDTSVYDPVTGTRFVLDRLGGSVIHAWKADGTLLTFDGGAWPTELGIDVEARRLYAPQHFTSSITAWDLDTYEVVDHLDLPFYPNSSDTLGDFGMDTTSGLGAVYFPETGSVAAFELNPLRLVWSFSESSFVLGQGKGAGGGLVQLDPTHDQLYVFVGLHNSVETFALADGSHLASATLAGNEKLAYTLNSIFLDPVDGQLYLGDDVLQTPELSPVYLLDDMYRVVCRDGDRLFALRALGDNAEQLVTLSPTDGTTAFVADLGSTTGMRFETECDPNERTLTVASLEQAEVRVYSLPR